MLATLTLVKMVEAWHSLTIAFLVGVVEAFDRAARRALFPHLVTRPALVSAVALNSAIWSGTRVVAPAATGLIIARFNPAAAFYLAALGFAVMAVAVYGLDSPPRNPVARASPIKDMLERLSFIRRSSVFTFLVAMTFDHRSLRGGRGWSAGRRLRVGLSRNKLADAEPGNPAPPS
ncbi:MAG: MFS transporter [Chloroflexi bacterium]|nr:MFS transporter [Chloroflexota bacterium]